MNDVGKPCEGEPHARIDGGKLETESRPPRQLPTLLSVSLAGLDVLSGVPPGTTLQVNLLDGSTVAYTPGGIDWLFGLTGFILLFSVSIALFYLVITRAVC